MKYKINYYRVKSEGFGAPNNINYRLNPMSIRPHYKIVLDMCNQMVYIEKCLLGKNLSLPIGVLYLHDHPLTPFHC